MVSPVGASGSVRVMKTAEEIRIASKMFKGNVNDYTSLARRLGLGKAWGRSAAAKAAKAAFVTAALAEGAISVYCAIECDKK